ncbi:MAG: threonine/serine exporter family protein [Clostridium sp.]|nr:threonine/serine exporter family protein [Clostridium sp.]
MNIDRLLNFASDVGKTILQSGGEIYRVEETISIICKSFDIEEVNVFASPTVVIVSLYIDENIHTVVKRIENRGVDLNKVHRINSLSRKISLEKPSLESVEKEFKEIMKDDNYPFYKTVLFSGIATSTFTILFGGNLKEFLCSFLIGVITKLASNLLNKTSLNQFFINSLCGSVIAISSVIFLNCSFISEIDKVIAGSIMLLVPGLSLTNAIRDTLEGQLVSGLTKAFEALFIGVSTAVGTFSAIHIFKILGGM